MDQTVHSARPVVTDTTARNRPSRKAGAGRKPAASRSRTNDPERTASDIMRVAAAEFAEKGLAGARIDDIAAATKTSKRMIYYYFGSKEGLYIAVLETAYRAIRAAESELHLSDLAPEDALRKLVGSAFDRCQQNPWYIRLVMNENIERGKYIRQSKAIQKLNIPVIDAITELYQRGIAQGVFRSGLDPVDIHASISALTFFNVSNQHTFGCIFNMDLQSVPVLTARRDSIIEMIVRFMRK